MTIIIPHVFPIEAACDKSVILESVYTWLAEAHTPPGNEFHRAVDVFIKLFKRIRRMAISVTSFV